MAGVTKKRFKIIRKNIPDSRVKEGSQIEFNPMVVHSTKEEPKKPTTPKHTAMAIHAATQFYNDPRQLSLFSEDVIESYSKATGLKLTDKPNSFGVVLNRAQKRVFEGILQAFSQTNYKGSRQIAKEEDLKKRGIKVSSQTALRAIEKAYKNIDSIPIVKLTQAELIRLAGYSTRHEDKNDTTEALAFLATKQFCFYWERLKKDDKGIPVKDKKGSWVKEQVMAIDSLFKTYIVRDSKGVLQYYEISPSSVILDQVNQSYGGNYFLLIPNDWREEVKIVTGKRGSNYTYEFLFWLRLQFEHKRRYNKAHTNRTPKPLTIKKTWEEIAITLKMPESMYKANKKRAAKIIDDAYQAAIKLNYLTKVDRDGPTDVLYLNEKFYPQPGELK